MSGKVKCLPQVGRSELKYSWRCIWLQSLWTLNHPTSILEAIRPKTLLGSDHQTLPIELIHSFTHPLPCSFRTCLAWPGPVPGTGATEMH